MTDKKNDKHNPAEFHCIRQEWRLKDWLRLRPDKFHYIGKSSVIIHRAADCWTNQPFNRETLKCSNFFLYSRNIFPVPSNIQAQIHLSMFTSFGCPVLTV